MVAASGEPGADLVGGDRAEAFGLARGRRTGGEVGGEVGQGQVQEQGGGDRAAGQGLTSPSGVGCGDVRRSRVAWPGGDDAQRLGLADPVGRRCRRGGRELGFGRRPGRGRRCRSAVSPAASSQEVPAKSPGRGWVRVTCQPARLCCSFCSCCLGACRAAASATSRSMVGSPNPVTRSASWASTRRAPSSGRVRVSVATRRAFHGATARAWTRSHSRGRRWCRSSGVGHQAHRRLGGDPQRGTQLLCGERGHRRTSHRHPARRRSRTAPGSAGVAPGGGTGLGGGRVQQTPLVGQLELLAAAPDGRAPRRRRGG